MLSTIEVPFADGEALPTVTQFRCLSFGMALMSDEGSIEIVAAPEFKRRICDRCLYRINLMETPSLRFAHALSLVKAGSCN